MLDATDFNLLYEYADSRDHRALPVPYKAAALYCTIGTLCDMTTACTRTCTSLFDHDISAARERHDRGMGMAVYTGARAKIQALAQFSIWHTRSLLFK